MGTNTVASMVVFEGGAPKKSDYRRFSVFSVGDGAADARDGNGYGPDDFASMEEILGRRWARWESQRDVSPHDKDYDPSFAALPNLVVIDGGKGQLAAGLRALQGFRDRGVTVVSLAKRIEEVFVPNREAPLLLAHDTPELQLLQRVRDEAHRFAITHHRIRRDRAMTASVLDELPGVGPARKRALLAHFGSPDAILSASARSWSRSGAARQTGSRDVPRAAQVRGLRELDAGAQVLVEPGGVNSAGVHRGDRPGDHELRFILFDRDGKIVLVDQREPEQINPERGWSSTTPMV